MPNESFISLFLVMRIYVKTKRFTCYSISFLHRNNNDSFFLAYIYFNLDASSSNEAVHLQQRLKSLSSELVTLRNRLHVSQTTGEIVPNTLNKNIVTAPNGIPNATMSKTHPMIVGPPIMPTGNSQRMHHKVIFP